jgi:DNA-binding response OmpR family regulator
MEDKKQILKTLTVLYAEDDEITRNNISKTLSLFVHKVISVKNGAEAFEMFEKHPCHIVLLDYVMPIIDGNSVAQKIREDDSIIPIIILSSHTEKEKLLNAIKTGVTEYLEKPVSFEALYSALMDAVQKLIDSGRLMTRLGEEIKYSYVEKTLHTSTTCERLTKNEYQFLEMLLQNPMSLVTKEELEEKLFLGEVEPNAFRNMVYRLRKKIPVNVIITIKDLGFMFKPA